MTLENQRVEIAEWMGFTGIRYDWINGSDSVKDWMHDKGRGIPDYPNDLNAIHDAEKKLTPMQWNLYTHFMEVVTRNPMDPVFQEGWQDINCSRLIDALLIHATASQRSEALLKSIDRWKHP